MDFSLKAVQDLLDEQLSTLITHNDRFRYKKSNFEYVAKGRGVLYIFRINLLKIAEGFKIKLEAYLGIPQVNKTFVQIFNIKKGVNSPTFGFGLYNVCKGRGDYVITSLSNISHIIKHIVADFVDVVLPFFDSASDVKAIDLLLTEKDLLRKIGTLSVRTACSHLILAKQCSNTLFDKLETDYYELLKQSQGELAEPILKVRKALL